ncbi:hypothetical protein [uncultured Cyclobacterium sp.]|uniref:hypothetical protein n=1 Tax=uncultured Cyclobacterium sp. TaxID=453820 RepID=UPI0030EEA932|tara:strand:- start:1793 stop:2701 length:909 start_codon:yes stop_codon:yes gene_type:complete
MKKILLFISFCFLLNSAKSQTKQFRYRVIVPNYFKYKNPTDTVFIKYDSLFLKSVNLKKGTIISTEGEYKKNRVTYKYLVNDTLSNSKEVEIKTSQTNLFKNGKGYATLKVDEKDKSKIHINYWLGKKYDREKDYYIKLKNRQSVKFWYNTIEGGALTIPFKYRPRFNKNGIEVEEQFNSDLNVGMYIGYSFGQVKYIYRQLEETQPTDWKVSIGPFFSVSTTKIDSSSTSSAETPLTKEVGIATFSPGVGLMTSVSDFRFGVFVGKDITFGKTGQKWNYHNKTWFGFGVGYNLGLIWGKSE